MNLRLRNSWKYVGDDRWDWSIYLEDDGVGDIDNVLSVEYLLHPTFGNPRRLVENKDDNFALKSNGWGTFLIRAFVHTKEGEKLKLKHTLCLAYEPEQGETL